MVGTVKSTLKKAKRSGEDPHLAMLCLRSTPLDSQLEILFGRKTRSNLPIRIAEKETRTRNRLEERQTAMKEYHDMRAQKGELPELVPGMKVAMQFIGNQKWNEATIVEKCAEPRSYIVQTANGSKYRRNRKHLKEIPSLSTKDNLDYIPVQMPDRQLEEVEQTQEVEQAQAANTQPQNAENRPIAQTTPRRTGRPRKPPVRLLENC